MSETLRVSAKFDGWRLDRYLAENARMTRSQAQKLAERGLVSVSGTKAKKNRKVSAGELISFQRPSEEPEGLIPQDLPILIVYRDDHLMVVNKPHDLVMYPAAGHSRDTLMNAVAYHGGSLASVGGPLRPGVVHRLDKDTSGLVVVALTDDAYYGLLRQFRERTVSRKYVALVFGKMKHPSGEIRVPIGRASSDRKKMSTRTRRGKEAVTAYRVIELFRQASLVEARLATGRTHQIRVHFASLGHPVLGDRTYGGKTIISSGNRVIRVPRQMLHARTLGFAHPETGEDMVFSAPVPDDMEAVMGALRNGDHHR